ncbi:MAG: sigma 54-interacting transcriptional regulator [Kiritimatiellae bacterium]|nr:sigma 54-interacting transcriptional regulator [Kiritimatiellia bacterium]
MPNDPEPASQIAVLRDITSAIVRERDVRRLLETTLEILERRMGLLRGTVCLLEGDELRIEATSGALNAEERAHGRYKLGEGITGLVAKTGRSEIVPDVRKDRRFLNKTGARPPREAVSFICVPLVHLGQPIGTLSADRAFDDGPDATKTLARDVDFLCIVANVTAEAAATLREQYAEREALVEENARLRGIIEADAAARGPNPGGMVGECRAMRSLYEQIRQVAPSSATVLVRGPSGTGKELVARAIRALSTRKDKPFVVLNCAALPEALVESELFGHERGAFTDARERRIGRAEAADGGTLFLDEIGDLSPSVQVKLLRFLQEKTFSRVGSNVEMRSDVRFIAATSRDLEDLMAKRLFREDLYYRLSVFPLHVPPLAERPGDIMPLAQHFLARAAAKYGRKAGAISSNAANMLVSYGWPGNVRELENCMERAILTSNDGDIRGWNLPPALQRPEFEEDGFASGGGSATLAERLAEVEKRILQAALERHGGNRSAAGRELGISPRMMNYRLSKAGISPCR